MSKNDLNYKGKVITIKIERNIIGNIYRSYVGSKRVGISFLKQNVIDDAKKYILRTHFNKSIRKINNKKFK